ncbi:hypothetical protein ACFL67_00340 [candidate division KSB1 bacterium]
MPFTDVLSFEMSINDEVSPEEYLLVRPEGIAIDQYENILLADEACIKVFDQQGHPLRIVGRQGYGPGEFDRASFPVFSNTGFLSVIGGDLFGILHILDKDLNFVSKRDLLNYRELRSFFNAQNYLQPIFPKIYCYSQRKLIYQFSSYRMKEDQRIIENGLIYEDPDTIYTIYANESSDILQLETYEYAGQDIGGLYWAVLEDNRIVYIDAALYRDKYKRETEYVLTIVDPATSEKKTISQKCVQIQFADSLFERTPPSLLGKRDIEKNFNQIRSEFQYIAPVSKLLTDQNILFVDRADFRESRSFFDVFDMNNDIYIYSVIFSCKPDIIRNGFAYCLTKDANSIPIVEKYSIDPIVYGR